MNSAFIIVGGERDEDPTQVGFPEHDQMVDALPPDRANQPFRKAILPRRAGRDGLVANAHCAQAVGDNRAVNGAAVADQVAWRLAPGKASVISCAIHSAVGCAVTLIQTSSRRASRTMTRA